MPSPSPSRRGPAVPGGGGPMPSLARFRGPGEGGGWFVITKPGARADLDVEPPLRSDRFRNVVVGVVSLVAVLGCGLWAASHAGSLLGALLLLLLGGSVGALGGGMLAVLLSNLSRPLLLSAPVRRRRAERTRRVVRPTDERAWRLCEIGAALAASPSWAERTVDPERRVPAILWSAVRRSLVVDAQYRDAERAAAHVSLEDLARDTLAALAGERESLDAIEQNLRAVLAAAGRLDQQRARRAMDRRSAQAREREERELRTRLTRRSGAPGSPVESALQADSAAGLAAEAEVVAELLAESDAMLRELD